MNLVLLVIIFITAAFPLVFLTLPSELNLSVLQYFAKLSGLVATVLMVWQLLLGFRKFGVIFSKNLASLIQIHRILGRLAGVLVLTHTVFIIAYVYLQFNRNLLILDFESDRGRNILLGYLAFILIQVIIVTSAAIRKNISFRIWQNIHYLTYLIVPASIIHGIGLGSTIRANDALGIYWFALGITIVALLSFRLLHRLNIIKSAYKVIKINQLTQDTTEIILNSTSTKISPKPGQYIYLQKGLWGEAHPFTVSLFDKSTKNIHVTIKALGPMSTRLQKVSQGDTIYVDGPYGNFTNEVYREKGSDPASNRPIVLIAGGVGITPFIQIVNDLNSGLLTKQVYFFNGNKTEQDILFREDLKKLTNKDNAKLINVLSEQKDYSGETGFITLELLKKYLGADLTKYEFFTCGPPIMMKLVKDYLTGAQVPKSQQHFESFSE